jgi:hypothetical protein
VGSIAERDALTGIEEGDMCVVHGFTQTPITSATTTLSGTLYMDEDTIVADSAITTSSSVSFRDSSYNLDVRFQVSATLLMIRATDYANGYKMYQTRYESTDGITYTYVSGQREIPLAQEVTKTGTSWHDIFTKAAYCGSLTFEGMFQYTDGAWDYAKIGMDPSPSTVFSTSKYYSDSGIQQGTFIRANHKENYITVSNTEPEIKTKLWFKPVQKADGTAVTKEYTNANISNYVKKPSTYAQFKKVYNPEVVVPASATESTTANVNRPKVINGDYLYILNHSDGSSNKAYKFNLTTGARSTIALCPYSSHTMWDSCTIPKVYNGYIYALCHLGNNSGIRRYNISSNAWSTVNTTDYDMGWYKYLFDYNNVWYILNSTMTKCLVFNPSSNSGSVRSLPASLVEGTYAEHHLLFTEGTQAYFYNYTDSKFVIYDYVSNTVIKQISFDVGYKNKYDLPMGEWNDSAYGADFQDIIYSKDGVYAYSFDKESSTGATISSPYNYILTVNIPIVKEAFAKNDATIIFNKGGIIKSEVSMYAPYITNGIYKDGYFYSYFLGDDKVVKYTLDDVLACNFPVSDKYVLVFDISKDSHNVEIGECERLLFNDIFLVGTRGYKDLVKGNVYKYDEIKQEYVLLIENVVE